MPRKPDYDKYRKFKWVSIRVKRLDDGERRRRRIYTAGVSTGLGVKEFVSVIFAANEKFTPKQKLTDTAIAKKLIDEFPRRPIVKSLLCGRITVNALRNKYNAGFYTGKFPEAHSHRWTIDGKIANGKTGLEMKPHELEKLAETMKKDKRFNSMKIPSVEVEQIMYRKIHGQPRIRQPKSTKVKPSSSVS